MQPMAAEPWVIASHNVGKAAEFSRLLTPFGITVRTPFAGEGEIVAETGPTYRENARLKAAAVARQGHFALGDDSGLEVEALDGAPGLYTAHFVSDDPWQNNKEVLLRLMDRPWPKRRARMVAALCLAAPDGRVWESEGAVSGWILPFPRGQEGFGVDPIFTVDGRRSLAEWSQAEKDRVSHRGEAVRRLVAMLAPSPAIRAKRPGNGAI